MRDLPIAYGNSCNTKIWSNKTISFEALEDRLRTTIRTPESSEEYRRFTRGQKQLAKDHGGFVGGVLEGGRRLTSTVASRSMVALDGDYIAREFIDGFEDLTPYTSCFYTTHSHIPDDPRIRIVFPLTRDVTPEEFVAVARFLAKEIGIDYFDSCSYLPNQLMYWPSTPSNGEFIYKQVDKAWVDPDEVLNRHPEWRDPARLPTSSRESKADTTAFRKVADPLEKSGVVGLFNRAYYPVSIALEELLPDVYEATDSPNRYHLIESSSMPGVEIKDEKFVYSHHAKDPAYLQLCNAFDIVRMHRFGDEDEKKSFKDMTEFAASLERVSQKALEEKQAQAAEDFGENAAVNNTEWANRLERDKRGTVLNNLHNIRLIMENDRNLKGIVFNQLVDGMEIQGDVPWKHPAKFWRDADDAQLICYVDSQYGSFSQRNYEIGIQKVTDDRSYHPIREYLENLPEWDGVDRVETYFIDYLGAEDNPYVRAVTRKILCAAYKRVYHPGIKFDYCVVLNGSQGIGKSTAVSRLGMQWYSDSLALSDMNDKSAAEKLQGYWILEIGELAGMKKADIDKVKAFISRQDISTGLLSEGVSHRIRGNAFLSEQRTRRQGICGISRETAGSGRSGFPGSVPTDHVRSRRKLWIRSGLRSGHTLIGKSCFFLRIWKCMRKKSSWKRWSRMTGRAWSGNTWILFFLMDGRIWICSGGRNSSGIWMILPDRKDRSFGRP